MEFPYTINDLSTSCKVSKQSIYNLIKKNQEFVKQNSTRHQRTIYYNKAVLDFLFDYYRLDKTPSDTLIYEKNGGGTDFSVRENPPTPTFSASEVEHLRTNYENQIAALNAEIDRLKADLNAKEEERKELLTQHGALILALSQERQEIMRLLPAPKKPFGERIKSLFHKENKP